MPPVTSAALERDRDASYAAEALPFLDDVYRFSRSLTRDESDAEDIVQDTFLRAYRSWHTFEPGTDARRWLFTIARNVFLRSRERAARSVAMEDPDLERAAAREESTDPKRDGVDAILSRVDLGPAISDAIAELPEVYRLAVVLVDVEDLSYEEAAEILDVPIGTVRSRLFRGRRILQQKLTTYARDAGFAPAARSGAREESNG